MPLMGIPGSRSSSGLRHVDSRTFTTWYSTEAKNVFIEPGSEITIFLADRQSEFLLLGMWLYDSNLA